MKAFTLLVCAVVFGNLSVHCEPIQSTSFIASVPLKTECGDRISCYHPAKCVSGICRCLPPYVAVDHRCVLNNLYYGNPDSASKASFESEKSPSGEDTVATKPKESLADSTIVGIRTPEEGPSTLQFYRLVPLQLVTTSEPKHPELQPLSFTKPLLDAPLAEAPRHVPVVPHPFQLGLNPTHPVPFVYDRNLHGNSIPAVFQPPVILPHQQRTVHPYFYQGAPAVTTLPNTRPGVSPIAYPRGVVAPGTVSQPLPLHIYQPPYHPHISTQPEYNTRMHVVPPPPTAEIPLPPVQAVTPGSACYSGQPCAQGSVCHMNICVCPSGFVLTSNQCVSRPIEGVTRAQPPFQPPVFLSPTVPQIPLSNDGCTVPCAGIATCVSGFCICPNNLIYNRAVGCAPVAHMDSPPSARLPFVSAGNACSPSTQCSVGAVCSMGVCRCTPAFTQLGPVCLLKHLKPQSNVIENNVDVNSAPSHSSENSDD